MSFIYNVWVAVYRFNDFDIEVDVPTTAPPFFAEHIENNSWERYECEIIQMAVKSWHRVLEGGAGLGVTSALIGRRAEFSISFEANPTLHKAAKKNQALNRSKTKVVNAALGSSDSSANFLLTEDWWTSKLVGEKIAKSKNVKVVDAQKIIDKYDINALVLDVEGAEEIILPHIDLSKIFLLIVELHGNTDKKRLLSLIENSGLKRKNSLSKIDHSVVWYERPTDFRFKLKSFLNLD